MNLHLALHAQSPSPSNLPAWNSLWLDPWQLSLKYSNSSTELPSDSLAQLVRAGRPFARLQVVVFPWVIIIFLPPSFSSWFLFFPGPVTFTSLRSDCHIQNMFNNWVCASNPYLDCHIQNMFNNWVCASTPTLTVTSKTCSITESVPQPLPWLSHPKHVQ